MKPTPNKVTISKIEIKIGPKVLSLTLEEAKALKVELDNLFEGKTRIEYYPITTRPAINYEPIWQKDVVWCGDDTNKLTFTCGSET